MGYPLHQGSQGGEDSDQCLYQTLSLVDVRVNVVSLDSTAIIEIRGQYVSPRHDYIVQDGSSLRDVLEDNGVAKNADRWDELPDSWEFAFSVMATR